MYVLGISSCFNYSNYMPDWFFHDAAAVLIKDGEVIAGVEEERLNRIKHTNKFCCNAIQFCLEREGITLQDVDRIAFFFTEGASDYELQLQYLKQNDLTILSAKQHIIQLLNQNFSTDIHIDKLVFVNHHLSHAYSTYFQSGFDSALIVVLDGEGDEESISIYSAHQDSISKLYAYPESKSLGRFFSTAIEFLGYGLFDEYKVMGLAPYGNPEVYREIFQESYQLLEHGDYDLNLNKLILSFTSMNFPIRRKGELFLQEHKNFASSLQETLEIIVMHILKYWQAKSSQHNLCLAGGVAHNCTVNGKIAYSELFKKMFVHPASHDAGAALGAALQVYHQVLKGPLKSSMISHVFWGPSLGTPDWIKNTLSKWEHCLHIEKRDDIYADAAHLIAEGQVIGWVHGSCEFGPRALGNRSILADPRRETHKDLINSMVKKRESYRPFAPSIMQEYVSDYYLLPTCEVNLEFMVYNLQSKPNLAIKLPAVTHINGTSRVQSVNKLHNPHYWNLINAFYKITDVPVVLNTSFNNRVEPIVTSIEDSITCFLTTGLNYLIINNYLIRKKYEGNDIIAKLQLKIPKKVILRTDKSAQETMYSICYPHQESHKRKIISKELYNFLEEKFSSKSNYASLLEPFSEKMKNEIYNLWYERYVYLTQD